MIRVLVTVQCVLRVPTCCWLATTVQLIRIPTSPLQLLYSSLYPPYPRSDFVLISRFEAYRYEGCRLNSRIVTMKYAMWCWVHGTYVLLTMYCKDRAPHQRAPLPPRATNDHMMRIHCICTIISAAQQPCFIIQGLTEARPRPPIIFLDLSVMIAYIKSH